MRSRRLPALALTAAALALPVVGCGGSAGEDRPEVDATLLLDGRPDAADVGIATAVERGFDGAEGVHLRVRSARSPQAAIRLITTRRADFAVLDADRLAATPQVVGIMALTTTGAAEDSAPDRVLATSRRRLEEDPSVSRSTVRALLRGYETALTDPASSLSDMQSLFPRADRAQLEAQLDRLGTSIWPANRQMGALPDAPQYEPGIVPAAAAANREP